MIIPDLFNAPPHYSIVHPPRDDCTRIFSHFLIGHLPPAFATMMDEPRILTRAYFLFVADALYAPARFFEGDSSELVVNHSPANSRAGRTCSPVEHFGIVIVLSMYSNLDFARSDDE